MASIPSKVASRLAAGIKKFQPILVDAKNRDVNESDTVTIVNAILSEVFGYDPFREITSEKAVKSTLCDLAIKLNDNTDPCLIIEVKRICMELKKKHVDQVGYYGSRDKAGKPASYTKFSCSTAATRSLIVMLKVTEIAFTVTLSPTWRRRESFTRVCWDRDPR